MVTIKHNTTEKKFTNYTIICNYYSEKKSHLNFIYVIYWYFLIYEFYWFKNFQDFIRIVIPN